MLDIKWIRENPTHLDKALEKRGQNPISSTLLELDEARRHLQTTLQDVQNARNLHAKTMGEMRKNNQPLTEDFIKEGTTLKEKTFLLETEEKEKEKALKEILEGIPNIPLEEVPLGKTSDDNVCLKQWGSPPSFSFPPLEHWALGEESGQMDFKAGAHLSGSRFVVLKSELARLERALAHFMLDVHTQTYGYTEISPPYLVRSEILYGTGQLPKFGEDSFSVPARHDHLLWLIATAEIPLTNLVADKILQEQELPLRMVAHTPCFRSEAGAAGKDTRGMIRMHQFHKVELVSITTPEQSKDEHERMTNAAESILQKLELPYRVMLLCTGDMGASACKTYDLEVWLPGQNQYREISSCSQFKDYQARRMGARYRPTESQTKTLPYVHTLNGSGLAVGRTLVALLENYQNEDKSITIPTVLRPYMNNQERILCS